MLCNSAASSLTTMSRFEDKSLLGLAAGTLATLLVLALPAAAITTRPAVRHHARVVSAKPAPVAKAAPAAKPAHVHTASAKPAAHTRHHAVRTASAKTPTAPAKPTAADFAAAARVHSWEASQHSDTAETATSPTTAPASTATNATAPQKATAADFIRAAQPQAPAPATPAPAPHMLRAPKDSATASKPLSPAVARMLPGADKETSPGLADAEANLSPMVAPAMVAILYDRRGRLIMPPALKGSHEILVHQNVMADSEGLDRIQDDADLNRKVANKQLVPLPASSMLRVDDRLPENRRYCRPWVAQFLADMARAHYARFHSPLQVNSAVRTVDFQERLRHTNGNAAPADGDTASPHLTGLAVDIAKKPLSPTEIAWMRGYLLPLEQQGKIDVEEEFQQACFHMSVYRKYVPGPAAPPRSHPAASATDALAAALR